MMRSLLRWIGGYVKIRVEGLSTERFINLCSRNNIYIRGLAPSGNGYEMYLALSDFRKIRPLAHRSHTRIRVTGRYGMPFSLFRWRHRKLFFAGILLCAALLKIYSLFIWDIRFEGNVRWPDETLAAFLREEDTAPLMLRSRVDCPGIVKKIRKEYNDIVWVSASIDGSRLNIRIKENDDADPAETGEAEESRTPTDLVASSDGVITKIVTRSGVPLVHEGDQVKKGDILVLGRIEVTDDTGEAVDYQYCNADADIYADTTLNYERSIPLTEQEKSFSGKEKHMVYVRLGNSRISLGSTANDYKDSETSVQERPLKAGENFYLPVSLGIKTVRSCTFRDRKVGTEEVQALLSADFERFCDELREKGVQIRGNNVKINLSANMAEAKGVIWITERITEEKDTEIVTVERKETDESVGTDD